jgi:hypothetical protein
LIIESTGRPSPRTSGPLATITRGDEQGANVSTFEDCVAIDLFPGVDPEPVLGAMTDDDEGGVDHRVARRSRAALHQDPPRWPAIRRET